LGDTDVENKLENSSAENVKFDESEVKQNLIGETDVDLLRERLFLKIVVLSN
jgi:hypothetical protein